MRLTRFGEGQNFGWLSMSQVNLMARRILSRVVLCALVASTRSWAPSATYGAGRVVRLRSSAEFVGDARDALRGASSKLEAPLRALELELQEAKRETDAAERALASALAAVAASEADARSARGDVDAAEAAKTAEVAAAADAARRSNERRVAAARTLAETAESDAKREIRATVVALESQIGADAAAKARDAAAAARDAAAAARAATAADVAAAEADGAARLEAAQLRLRAVTDEDAAEDEPLVVAVAASALAGFLLFSNQLQGGLSPFSLFGALLGAFLFAAFGLKAPEKA